MDLTPCTDDRIISICRPSFGANKKPPRCLLYAIVMRVSFIVKTQQDSRPFMSLIGLDFSGARALDDLGKTRAMSQSEEEFESSKIRLVNVVALGNVGAGKSQVLNSLIGHIVLPTGTNGVTKAPVKLHLASDSSLGDNEIIWDQGSPSNLQPLRASARIPLYYIEDKFSDGASWEKGDEICIPLRTSTAPPLTIIDLPGLNQGYVDESMIAKYADVDAILLVILCAKEVSEISSSRALEIAKKFDPQSTRTLGIINALEQNEGNKAVESLLSYTGPPATAGITWVALISQLAQSGSGECEILRTALLNTICSMIRRRVKDKLPELFQSDRHRRNWRTSYAVNCNNVDRFLGGDSDMFKYRNCEGVVIVDGDVVRNRETGIFGVVYGDEKKVLTFSRQEDHQLGKDDTLWLRLFGEGDKVRTIEDGDAMGVVEVDWVERTVCLTSGDDVIEDVDVRDLKPFRITTRDRVSFGDWSGHVKSINRRVTLSIEGEDDFSVDDPSVEVYQPIYKSELEKVTGDVYHLGQKVLLVGSNRSAIVKSHFIHQIGVQWVDRYDKTPPPELVSLPASEVKLLDCPWIRKTWSIGQRCFYEGTEFLIEGCSQSLVRLKHYPGTAIASNKLLHHEEEEDDYDYDYDY